MHYGICLLSVVPCRKEAGNSSEMVTQLLFGESYMVEEFTEDWLKIITAFDSYQGWINIKQHQKISESTFQLLQKENPVYNAELIQVITNKVNQTHFPISIGARLPFLKTNTITFEQHAFLFDGQIRFGKEKRSGSDIISTAFTFLNSPYLWGGKNPLGIDCSGFTQVVFKLNGYILPRDASQQVALGEPLNFVEEAEAGDLAFFDNEEGNIVHVGILMDNQRIIHASGQVRIDKFDHYGIYNEDSKKYTHTLRVIKRLP
jgi:gamma-D-glutamyl-L-lysine dipeptidyl-peptidase